MICIYVSTYDLNKCPLLSCFMCLMNFILEIGDCKIRWGIMLPYLWEWLHKGGCLCLVQWWCHQTGEPSGESPLKIADVETNRVLAVKQLWNPEARASVQGGVWWEPWKNSTNAKGIQLWRLLTLVFISGDLITGPLPFFLSTKRYHWIIMKYYEVFEDDITSTAFNRQCSPPFAIPKYCKGWHTTSFNHRWFGPLNLAQATLCRHMRWQWMPKRAFRSSAEVGSPQTKSGSQKDVIQALAIFQCSFQMQPSMNQVVSVWLKWNTKM